MSSRTRSVDARDRSRWLRAIVLAAAPVEATQMENPSFELPRIEAATPDGVQWSAPEACPDDREVERRIAGYVAVPADVPPRVVVVQAIEGGFEATVSEPGRPPRTMTDSSCDTLADAIAVVIALAVEAARDEAARPPEPAVTPPPEPVREEPRIAADADSRRAVAVGESRVITPTADTGAPRLGIGLRAGVGYTSAIAPSGAGIVELGANVGRRWWSVELDGRVFLPRTFEAATFDYGARIVGGAARLGGCGRPSVGRVGFPICVGLEAGRTRVDPRGLPAGRRQDYPWLATVIGAGLRLAVLERLAVWVGGELFVPLLRASLDVAGAPPLWQTARVGGRALVALEVRLR